jgi:CRISPR/Cas system-associated endonuclease/helicase Cas3
MPFLSIIDQTARLYRKLFSDFPDHYILEDHSIAQGGHEHEDGSQGQGSEDDRLRRHLAENWDASIILTTNVRCLESLMSNRTSDCRKLHRMAKSVVLFDEVQTLTRDLAVVTLGTLSRLCHRFNATVLFATATQPAFEHLDKPVREIAAAGWTPRPLLPKDSEIRLFEVAAKRTSVHWEHETPIDLVTLADRLADESSDQWLCIVNLKRHAQQLSEMLRERVPEGLTHLSTSMCPAHRQRVLADVERRLLENQPVFLVSTQCVEAGVDIDFPVVYRALAPLEAIAQAAGRC